MGLFDKKDRTENKNALASQSEMKRPGDEISEDDLLEIIGGMGDAREEISEENADQGYAAGEMNDVDGWD